MKYISSLQVLYFSSKESLRIASQVLHGQVEGMCEDTCEDFSICFLDEMCQLYEGWEITYFI